MNQDFLQEKLQRVMQTYFVAGEEVGASVVVCNEQGVIAEVHCGHADRKKQQVWDSSTLVPVYSATKGVAAATLLLALEEAGLSPSVNVREIWQKFPLEGASVAQLLNHQCGLAWHEQKADIWQHEEVISALEAQKPAWQAPQLGYHPRTWGFLVEELVRRLTGETLGRYFERKIRRPLELDFWIGLPEAECARVAELITGKPNSQSKVDPLYQALADPESRSRKAFSCPSGLHSVAEMNSSRAHAAGFAAMGGVGSARALARFYWELGCGSEQVFSAQLRRWIVDYSAQGEDLVLLRKLRFACGFQQDYLEAGQKLRRLYGPSLLAFGHPGAGGSHAFVDVENKISFAYTMNQMELSVLPGTRVQNLVQALYENAKV